MAYGEQDVRVILDELAGGSVVSIGASRSHMSYGCRDGRWFMEAFDEGYTEEHAIDEATVRRVIAQHPKDFAPLLRAPHLRRFRAALYADDLPAARAALGPARAWGDPFSHMAIWDAVLAPSDDASASTIEAIVDDLQGHTAWHAFWDLLAWERTPANAERGLWFMDRLLALANLACPPPEAIAQRAAFTRLAHGDAS